MTSAAVPIHPFPARMAPELALRRLTVKQKHEPVTVLDPMMGSGTIPILAASCGHQAIGFDIDPLAVLIARTWGADLNYDKYLRTAIDVVKRASGAPEAAPSTSDTETLAFIDFWFDSEAQRKLNALAATIRRRSPDIRDALWCAFSRLIITKEASASRARDVSHSRPHRVRKVSEVDPIQRFPLLANDIVRRHKALKNRRAHGLRVDLGDARGLPLADASVDLSMTSPPYLTAIDYLRGHRMTLVWMGYALSELRELRGSAIGSERGTWDTGPLDDAVRRSFVDQPNRRAEAVLRRYATDLAGVIAEQRRVLKPGGQLTLVVSDGTLFGARVRATSLTKALSRDLGFRLTSHRERALPQGRRYLPPPMDGAAGSLDRRMRSEWALTFRRES